MIVGLTGGIGAGKTLAVMLFRQWGVDVIDADEIGKALTQKGQFCVQEIFDFFGDEIRLPDNSLNRRALRRIIFSSPEAKCFLENLLHPRIYEEIKIALQKKIVAPYRILSVPLLMEKQEYRAFVDRVLLIDCSPTLQIQRIVERDDVLEEDVEAILRAQALREDRLCLANDVVVNESTKIVFEQAIEGLHQKYQQLSYCYQ